MSSSRRPSFGTGSQVCSARSSSAMGAGPQQQQQQPLPSSQRLLGSHIHQPSIGSSNPALLNTELRAQARRVRDATRVQSKEKMQNGTATTQGRERSASVVSMQQHVSERKVSPKMVAKSSAGIDGRTGHTTRTTVARHLPKTSHGGESHLLLEPAHQTAGEEHAQMQSQDRYAPDDSNLLPRQHFGNLASRIPSPPKGEETRSEFDSMQTAYFVKYYYDMVEKCHSWQRYASNMKAKAETLDIENRILKDINEKQDRDIRALETELASLRQATMVHEHERRRAESKLSCYSHRLSPSNSSGELSNRYLRQATSKTTGIQPVDVGIDALTMPSPPLPGHGNHLMDTGHLTIGTGHLPYCSSNMHSSDNGETATSSLELRPPTPTSAVSLPHSLQAVLLSRPTGEECHGDRRQQSSRRGHQRNDSNIGDIIAQDAANREAGSGGSYDYDLQPQHIGRGWHRQRYIGHMSSSNTFPTADVVPSAALTMHALAAMNGHGKEQTHHRILPTSNSVPQLASEIWDRPSSPDRLAKRQVSAGEASDLSTKPKDSQEQEASASEGEDDAEAEREGAYSSGERMFASGEESSENANGVTRGGSALSDAVTVTGDYLLDIVEQKRRLRKVSHSQQQQLHYLQARIHLNTNANGSQASLPTAAGGSRPSSRLSNQGGRGKARSRAGSYTVHDSIPVAKDDLFSDDAMANHTRRAGGMPLGAVDINRPSASSAVLLSDEEDSVAAKVGSFVVHGEPEVLESGTTSDTDPKGAHRRLYIRLRDELQTADLVRFERYVHRYDALEIGIDGSRGIVNRVRRLLLPDELVRAKATMPDKYRFRKELAREFERIVREDAIPREGSDSQVLADAASDVDQS